MASSCGKCRFWNPLPDPDNLVGDGEAGECRRFPPRLALDYLCERGIEEGEERGSETIDEPGRFMYTHFAVTLKDCWCGEFKVCDPQTQET